MKIPIALILSMLILLTAGCHKKAISGKAVVVGQEMVSGQPPLEAPEFEVVWVDPRVIASDQAMTLICADRLDSIQHAAGEVITAPAPAVAFDILDRPCLTTVRMLDSRGAVLKSLLTKTLQPGHYKLTIHKPPPAANPNIPYNYVLEAIFCGQTKAEHITSGWTGRR
jgi:hypothetical protein